MKYLTKSVPLLVLALACTYAATCESATREEVQDDVNTFLLEAVGTFNDAIPVLFGNVKDITLRQQQYRVFFTKTSDEVRELRKSMNAMDKKLLDHMRNCNK